MNEENNEQVNAADEYAKAYAARDMRTGAPVTSTTPAAPDAAPFVQAPARKGHPVLIAVVVCVLAIFAMGALSCSATVSHLADSTLSVSSSSSLARAVSPSVAVIDIDSVIGYDGSASSPDGLKTRLDAAEADELVKGVILRVNSGGGTATAGEEMSELVKAFSKPIVVVSAATNASAAYEISSQADYIFCAKTTAIGAIGVLMQVTDLSGLYEKLGIDVDTIVSTESKDAGNGNRPLTEEEREWYQGMVDEIDADFIETVAAGRNMTVAEVKALANGLPYTGLQAVEVGLADEIGYFDDARAYLSNLVGSEQPLDLISYESDTASLDTLMDLLTQSEATAPSSEAVLMQ